MSPSRELSRVGWTDERPLAASDLRHAVAHARRVRSRHVLDVHRTWGVVHGLRAGFGRPPTQVLVSPGLAYDACGAELPLARATAVAFPAQPADGTLLVIRADRGGCPELAWVAPGEPRRDGVALARLDLGPWGVALDPAARRRAASVRRPAIRSGTVHKAWSQYSAPYPLLVDVDIGRWADAPRLFATVNVDAGALPAGAMVFATVEDNPEPAVGRVSVVVAFRSGVVPSLPTSGGFDVRWLAIERLEEHG